MTHPLLTAIDAALAEHGWPADVKMIALHAPLHFGSRNVSVTLGKVLSHDEGRALACTAVSAYADALAEKLEHDKKEAAKAAARKLLADAGIDPDLVR